MGFVLIVAVIALVACASSGDIIAAYIVECQTRKEINRQQRPKS